MTLPTRPHPATSALPPRAGPARALLDLALFAGFTLAGALPIVAEAARGALRKEAVDRHFRRWAERIVRHTQLRLEVEGAHDVDWSRTYLLMSNHQSHLDVPVLLATVPVPLRMVAKKELFRIPIWGRAIREAGIISIDREDRPSAIESLRVAGACLAGGTSVWLAPEGSRSMDGTLGPLKKGGFVLAAESGTPILPVAIAGTRDALPRGELRVRRGVSVRVSFGPPIEAAGRHREALREEARAFLERELAVSAR